MRTGCGRTETHAFPGTGTLLDTAVAMVCGASSGYFADELESVVHVAVKDSLRHLVESGRLQRRPCPDRYLYGAADRARWQEQWAARQAQVDELPAAIALFYGLLDEKQRRLYAGLESLQSGHGAIGAWPNCWDWMWPPWPAPPGTLVRTSAARSGATGGAGACRWKKNGPSRDRIAAVAHHGHGGDPMGRRGLWTGLRLRQIAARLRRIGLRVSRIRCAGY